MIRHLLILVLGLLVSCGGGGGGGGDVTPPRSDPDPYQDPRSKLPPHTPEITNIARISYDKVRLYWTSPDNTEYYKLHFRWYPAKITHKEPFEVGGNSRYQYVGYKMYMGGYEYYDPNWDYGNKRYFLQWPNNSKLSTLASIIVGGSDSSDEKMQKIERWVEENIRYTKDPLSEMMRSWHPFPGEWWFLPTETLERKIGDCEDMAFLIHSLALHAGVPFTRLYTLAGQVIDSNGFLSGHAWTIYQRGSDSRWVAIETTSNYLDGSLDFNSSPGTIRLSKYFYPANLFFSIKAVNDYGESAYSRVIEFDLD